MKAVSTSITEATAERRKLVQSPYVDTATTNDIYDNFALFNEAAQEYLNASNDDINSLRKSNNDHDVHLDRTDGTRTAASSSTDALTSQPSG